MYTIHCHMVQNDAKCMFYNHYYENSNFLVPCPVLQEVQLIDTIRAFRIGLQSQAAVMQN